MRQQLNFTFHAYGKIVFVFLFLLSGTLRAAIPSDSVETKNTHRSNLKLTNRLHSAGMFGYSGRIVSDNPVADINVTYDRKTWGFMFMKVQDLNTRLSDMNFTLTGFYKIIHYKRITVTPLIAARMEQTKQFADKGSDAIVIITTAYQISPRFTIDNTTLFANVMLERKDLDWINRFRLLYNIKHLDTSLSAWNNNIVFDKDQYWSGGINASYNRIKISKHVYMGAGVTGIVMITTNDEEEFPKKNGVLFTLSATVH